MTDPHPSLHPNLHRIAGQAVNGAIGRGLTVATGESLTAGMLAAMLADTPGASGMLQGGVVSYQNAVKVDVLGVPRELLDAVGSVDGKVAAAMADGRPTDLRRRHRGVHHRCGRPRAARRKGRRHRLHRPRHRGRRRRRTATPSKAAAPEIRALGLRRRPGTAARMPCLPEATAA